MPTPLTDYQPDLSYVEAAAKSVGENLVSNQVIILESTTYPGTTLEVLIPNLERYSSLRAGTDFFVANRGRYTIDYRLVIHIMKRQLAVEHGARVAAIGCSHGWSIGNRQGFRF